MLFTLNLSQPRFTNEPCRRFVSATRSLPEQEVRRLSAVAWRQPSSRLPLSIYRRFLRSGSLGSLLGGGWLLSLGRLLRCRPFRRPTLLQCGDDCGLASGAQPPLRPGRDRRRRLSLLLGFSPSFPLCITDALPGGGTHLPPFAFWEFRRGGGRAGTAFEHLAEFGNLSIDTELLLFKALDAGVDDFGGEFVRGHKNQYGSYISCAASSGVLGRK